MQPETIGTTSAKSADWTPESQLRFVEPDTGLRTKSNASV
jgi:hypothetical protein